MANMDDSNKLTVLLLPANYHWAEGYIARGLLTQNTGISYVPFMTHDIIRRWGQFVDILHEVDVVHVLSTYVNLPAAAREMIRNMNVPLVASIYHMEPGGDSQIDAIKDVNVIHTLCDSVLKELRAFTDKPARVGRIGVKEVSPYIRRRRKNKPIRIGAVGAFREIKDRKRWDVMLSVVSRISSEHATELYVQGAGWRSALDVIQKNGISVINRGMKRFSEAAGIYSDIDILLCTSDIEGGPIPVLEAASHGVPVLSTDVGIAKDLLPDKWLVPKGDANGFVMRLKSLIEDESVYLAASADMLKAAEGYTWECVSRNYYEIYALAIELWEMENRSKWEKRRYDAYERELWVRNEMLYGLAAELSGYAISRDWIEALSVLKDLIKGARGLSGVKEALRNRNYS